MLPSYFVCVKTVKDNLCRDIQHLHHLKLNEYLKRNQLSYQKHIRASLFIHQLTKEGLELIS